MNRQRTPLTRVARPTAISLAGAKPVLRSSTKLNQTKQLANACMSYKELIKVVGVDCETGPSSWRKAIDHSAETVVFYQVDLRGTLPRMYKSVRIRREEGTGENKELRLVPSVYVGDTLLSGSYVKTIIGRRFLADEDDLMKLLEHAGILQEEEEPMQERDDQIEDKKNDDWDVDSEGNDQFPTESEPTRAKTFVNSHMVSKSAVAERGIRARYGAQSTENDASSAQPTSSRRQAIDLSPMLLDQIDQASAIPQAVEAEEDTTMDTDFDGSGLPAPDDNEELPFAYNCDDVSSPTGTIEEPLYHARKEDGSERDRSAEETDTPDDKEDVEKEKSTDAKKMPVPVIPFPFLAKYLPGGNRDGSLVPLTTRQLVFLPKEDVKELRTAKRCRDQTELYMTIMWEFLFTARNRMLCSEHLPKTGGVGFKAVCKYMWDDVWDFVREVGKRKVETDPRGNQYWRALSGEEHEKLWRSEQQSFRNRIGRTRIGSTSKIWKRKRARNRF